MSNTQVVNILVSNVHVIAQGYSCSTFEQHHMNVMYYALHVHVFWPKNNNTCVDSISHLDSCFGSTPYMVT